MTDGYGGGEHLECPSPLHTTTYSKSRRLSTAQRRAPMLSKLQRSKTEAIDDDDPSFWNDHDDDVQYNRAQTATIAPLLLGMSGLGGAVVRRNKRRISDFTDIAHLADSQDGIQLTQRQRELLKGAFCEADKKGKAGEWIMQRMLQDCPEVSKCLCAGGGMNDKSSSYARHCRLFCDVLDMAFESLDELDNSLGPLLVSYGSSHVLQSSPQDERQFHNEYWDVFSDAMCDYGLSWKIRSNRVETIQAWRMLVFFMLTKMKQGYTIECERLGLKLDTASDK